MHTFLVCVIYGAVAPGTSLGNMQAGILKKLACFLVSQPLLCVRVMAIGAYRCVLVASRQGLLVYAIKRQVELLRMTLLAGCVILQLDITQGLSCTFRMRETAYIRVAGNARHAIGTMRAFGKRIRADR